MVAKLKSSFLKNSFQLFCHKSLFNASNNSTILRNPKTTNRSLSSNGKQTAALNELNNKQDKKKQIRSSSVSSTSSKNDSSSKPIKKSESFHSEMTETNPSQIDRSNFVVSLRKNRSKSSANNTDLNSYINQNRYSYPIQLAEANDHYDNTRLLTNNHVSTDRNQTTSEFNASSSSSSPSSVSSASNPVKPGLYNKNSKSIAELKMAKKLQLMKQQEENVQLKPAAVQQIQSILNNKTNIRKTNGDFLTRLNDQLFLKSSIPNNVNEKRLINTKKVVRFADSLGLELENIITLNSSDNLVNIKQRFKNNTINQYQNNVNKINQFESENNNEPCLYDDIINQIAFAGENRSRYSAHYQTMQPKQQQINNYVNDSHENKNKRFLFSNQQYVNSNDLITNDKVTQWSATNSQSSNITTITTRLNNGKLESEV